MKEVGTGGIGNVLGTSGQVQEMNLQIGAVLRAESKGSWGHQKKKNVDPAPVRSWPRQEGSFSSVDGNSEKNDCSLLEIRSAKQAKRGTFSFESLVYVCSSFPLLCCDIAAYSSVETNTRSHSCFWGEECRPG